MVAQRTHLLRSDIVQALGYVVIHKDELILGQLSLRWLVCGSHPVSSCLSLSSSPLPVSPGEACIFFSPNLDYSRPVGVTLCCQASALQVCLQQSSGGPTGVAVLLFKFVDLKIMARARLMSIRVPAV
jgi:hypothetical protein